MILVHFSFMCRRSDGDHRSVKTCTKHNDLCLSCIRIEKRPAIKTTATKQRTWNHLHIIFARTRIYTMRARARSSTEPEKWPTKKEKKKRKKSRVYNFVVFSHRIRNVVVPFTQEVGKSISRVMPGEEAKKKLVCMFFDSLIE